jgi:hypothetical protein
MMSVSSRLWYLGAMSTAFLNVLLSEGRIALAAPVVFDRASEAEAGGLLERAFAEHRLGVAGPLLAFDRAVALAAAKLIAESAWLLVNGQTVAAEATMPEPKTPSQHLSADLLLRYVPALHRRARSLNLADNPLADRLADVLRRWPLSGVLGDITEGPLTPPDFGGHPGLCMLYAERLAGHFKPAWLPTGAGRQYVELVWTELGRDVGLLG